MPAEALTYIVCLQTSDSLDGRKKRRRRHRAAAEAADTDDEAEPVSGLLTLRRVAGRSACPCDQRCDRHTDSHCPATVY